MPNIFKQGDWGKSLELGMNMRKQMDNEKLLQEQAQQRQAEFNMKMEEFKLKLQEQRQKREDADKLNAAVDGNEAFKNPLIKAAWSTEEGRKTIIANIFKDNKPTIVPAGSTVLGADNKPVYTAPAASKPINMEVSYDSLGASYFPDYTVNPESQKAWNIKYQTLMSSPEGRRELLERRQSITPPSFAYPFTDQGMVPVITRGAGAGTSQIPTDYKKPVPAGELAKSGGMEALLNDIASVKELYKYGIEGEEKAGWVGPYDARWGGVREKFLGGLPPEQVKFYSYVRDMQDALLRARSGAQINEQEFRRLVAFLPSEKLPADTFKARLERFESELNNILKTKQDVFSASGYGSVTSKGGGKQRLPNETPEEYIARMGKK